MKLHTHSVHRLTNDQMRVTARWTDKMRRPAKVTVDYDLLQQSSPDEQLVIEGDVKEVIDSVHAVAELAWSMGWRPRGFPGALAAFAQHYKLPPQE